MTDRHMPVILQIASPRSRTRCAVCQQLGCGRPACYRERLRQVDSPRPPRRPVTMVRPAPAAARIQARRESFRRAMEEYNLQHPGHPAYFAGAR